MSKELIARLRHLYAYGDPITEEAADALEVQQSWLRVKDATIGQMANDMAAAQAQIKVLREALEAVRDQRIEGYVFPAVVDLNAWHSKVIDALATPPDDSALRELLKAERERVAKVVRDASFKIQSGSPHRKIFDAVVAEIRAMEDQ